MSEKFYVTTPLYYVNANPHIGHAYTQIAVDAVSRYNKMIGKEVFFMTGTDEHGEKIEEAAIKAGFNKGDEKAFVDSIVPNFKALWKSLNINYDHFIRTTDDYHEKCVQNFLTKMHEKGDIYLGEYDGYFCTPCETFWTDTQAEDGNCPDCGRPVDRIKEKNYFFKMSKYEDALKRHIKDNPDFIMPGFRKNEVLGFLKEGLKDLCISRSKDRMSWGIPLPFDEDFVTYVWFDALINYVAVFDKLKEKKDFWPADFHVIAKDILRHHAVFWPIMLMSVEIDLPKTVFAHGWWKMGEDKMSKSKGNIVDPNKLIEKYGVDPVRFFVLKAIDFGMDGNFNEEALVTMYNSDLANDMGNLLNRTLTMVEKYFGSVSPEVPSNIDDQDQASRSETMIKDEVIKLFDWVYEYMTSPGLRLKEALEAIFRVIGSANKYIESSAPWTYAKENKMDIIKLIMADLLEVLRVSAIGVYPFMPETAQKMWQQLGLKGKIKEEVDPDELKGIKDAKEWRRFPAGVKIAKGEPLFPRIQ